MKKLLAYLLIGMAMALMPLKAQNQDIAMTAFELRMNGQPYAALGLLDSALRIYPDSSRLWFEKGRCVDWTKTDGCDKFIHLYTKMSPRIRETQHCFNKAVRLDPGNARYAYWAGNNQAVLSLTAIYTPWQWPLISFKLRKAVRFEKKAVLLDPENPEYRVSLVEYARFGWLMGGNKKLAWAHLDTLDRLYPVHGVYAHRDMASKKHPYDGLSRLREIRASGPDSPRLIQEMIRPMAQMIGKDSTYIDTVMALYDRYMELNPGNPDVISRMYRFMNRYQTGDPMPYVDLYMQAVEGNYGYYRAAGLRLMADAAKKQGDEERAAELKREAAILAPEGCGSFMTDMEKP